MRILKRVAALLSVLISLSACAAPHAMQNPAAEFPFRHNDFDFRYAWKTNQTDQGIYIGALIKNVRYAAAEEVEVTVTLLNKEHKVISENTAFPIPQLITKGDYRSIGLLLKGAKLSEGDQLRFLVSYKASEGSQGLSWRSSFTVDAATGAIVGAGEKPADVW